MSSTIVHDRRTIFTGTLVGTGSLVNMPVDANRVDRLNWPQMIAEVEEYTLVPTKRQTRQHLPHVNYSGVQYWTCPDCGHINRDRFHYGAKRARCAESSCRGWFMFGHVIYRMALGSPIRNEAMPPDCVIGGQLTRRNARVNRVIDWTQGAPIVPTPD